MPAISTLQVVLEAKTKPFEDSMRRASSFTKGLKQTFGEESGFGMLAKGLVGAGAVAGITAMSRAIQNTAKEVEELNEKWALGQLTVGKYRTEVMKLIPVFGSAFSAGEELSKLFTGEGQRQFENRTRRELQGMISGMRSDLTNDPFADAHAKFEERQKKINALKLRDEDQFVMNSKLAGSLNRKLLNRDIDEQFAKDIKAANEEMEKLADNIRELTKTDTQQWAEDVDVAVELLAGSFIDLQTSVARIKMLDGGDKRRQGLSQFSASLVQSTKTAREVAIQEIDDINEAVRIGALRTTTAARRADQIISSLAGGTSIDLAGSALRGSQEAAGIMSGSRANEMQLDLQRQQTMQLGQMLGLSRDILDELQKWNAAKVIE